MDQEAEHSFCRGKSPGGGRCDCEEFLSSKDFDVTAPLRCAECHHGPSKHHRRPTQKTTSESVPTTSLPTPGSSVSIPTARQSVLSIFNQTVASSKIALPTQSTRSATAGSGSATSRKLIDVDSARKETLQGYRPGAAETRGKKEKASNILPSTLET